MARHVALLLQLLVAFLHGRACMVAVAQLVSNAALGNQHCYVGTDYSSNYDLYRDEWYYYYQFWPIGSVPSESQKVLGVPPEDRVNLLRRSEGIVETDCGPGFDACKTVVTTVVEDVVVVGSDDPIAWKYAKVEQSCAFYDYCYPRESVTSSNHPTQQGTQGTQKNYEVTETVLCCNDDFLCNDQHADEYSHAEASRMSWVAACLGAAVAVAAGRDRGPAVAWW